MDDSVQPYTLSPPEFPGVIADYLVRVAETLLHPNTTALLYALAKASPSWLTMDQIETELQHAELEVSRSQVLTGLTRLQTSGYIMKGADGQYRLHPEVPGEQLEDLYKAVRELHDIVTYRNPLEALDGHGEELVRELSGLVGDDADIVAQVTFSIPLQGLSDDEIRKLAERLGQQGLFFEKLDLPAPSLQVRLLYGAADEAASAE